MMGNDIVDADADGFGGVELEDEDDVGRGISERSVPSRSLRSRHSCNRISIVILLT